MIAAVLAKHDGADEVPDIAERYLTYGGWTREHGDYGLASGLGGGKKPSFATLEESVDLSHLRPEFRAASHEIHADSEGLRSNLFARGGENYALSGPTNAGLSRPGQLALIYLYQVTTMVSAVYPGRASPGQRRVSSLRCGPRRRHD